MVTLPELRVHSLDSPHNRPMWDLKRFLYMGAAGIDARWVWKIIESGELGKPQLGRVEFLVALKEVLETRLVSGQSAHSTQSYLSTVSLFIRYLDSSERSFSLERMEANYLEYAEHLFVAANIQPAEIKKSTAYTHAATLSALLGPMLDISDSPRLIKRTRLKSHIASKRALSRAAEKQSLEQTFKLGNFLVDLTAGLSVEAILGQLPLTLSIRPGVVANNQVHLSVGLRSAEWLSIPKDKLTTSQKSRYEQMKQARQPVNGIEGTLRWRLVNLRVQSEFLVFLAQTGMNITQAKELGFGALKYKPLGDSWQVRCYKRRKGGEVSFRIYKSYKVFLDRYRSFIKHFFSDSEFLFPQLDYDGQESLSRNGLKNPTGLRKLVKAYAVPWIPLSSIRNTRVNWFLRRSGDADLAAEMAQNTPEVFRKNYEQPSQQRSMVEITRFWNDFDPIEKGDLTGSVIAASRCNGQPTSIEGMPSSVVKPNCSNPSGCLWCAHHRDSDTEDYVWSLASMRHLKIIEAGLSLSQEAIPADYVIERLAEKLAWFKNSNSRRAQWVTEADQRISEGAYHPNWSNIIEFLE